MLEFTLSAFIQYTTDRHRVADHRESQAIMKAEL